MPKNVMKLIKPSPHRGRNDFDLSHRSVIDMNFGSLHSPMQIETVPNDDYRIGIADLLRTNSMVTSPFLRAKQHIDLWWVPYHDLWHNFEQFMVQREQPVSSALKSSSFLPHTSLWALYTAASNNAFQGSLTTDIVGLDFHAGAVSLLQELGYGYQIQGTDATTSPRVNLFRLAAYNYIWYNEYRQQYYDDGRRGLSSANSTASIFNFDDLQCDSQANAYVDFGNRLNAMVQRRYRCWKKDLFTGLMPATQFGNVSTLGDLTSVRISSQLVDTSSAKNDVNVVSSNKVLINSSVSGPSRSLWDISPNIDVLSLRRSEAVQIWRENALRAGNRVWDNYKAHYGVDSYFRDHRPTHIASVDAPLNISDVMTTANSTYSGNTNPNVQVGDIAGKGLCSMDKDNIKFHSDDFGVIIAISSILPEAEYNAYGIDRMNQLLESEDFFIPEYENLGLEAVSSQNFVQAPTDVAKVVGYAPRYYGYKTKLDKCFGTFCTNGINSPWCSPKYDVSALMGTPSGAIPLSVLYVNPQIYNVNFTVGVTVSPQFKADFYFDVDAVRPMSVLGLPFS